MNSRDDSIRSRSDSMGDYSVEVSDDNSPEDMTIEKPPRAQSDQMEDTANMNMADNLFEEKDFRIETRIRGMKERFTPTIVELEVQNKGGWDKVRRWSEKEWKDFYCDLLEKHVYNWSREKCPICKAIQQKLDEDCDLKSFQGRFEDASNFYDIYALRKDMEIPGILKEKSQQHEDEKDVDDKTCRFNELVKGAGCIQFLESAIQRKPTKTKKQRELKNNMQSRLKVIQEILCLEKLQKSYKRLEGLSKLTKKELSELLKYLEEQEKVKPTRKKGKVSWGDDKAGIDFEKEDKQLAKSGWLNRGVRTPGSQFSPYNIRNNLEQDRAQKVKNGLMTFFEQETRAQNVLKPLLPYYTPGDLLEMLRTAYPNKPSLALLLTKQGGVSFETQGRHTLPFSIIEHALQSFQKLHERINKCREWRQNNPTVASLDVANKPRGIWGFWKGYGQNWTPEEWQKAASSENAERQM